MKKRCGWIKLTGLALGLGLTLLSGCGVLSEVRRTRNEARLEISIDPAAPEGVSIVWNPALVSVEGAEVSVAGDERRTVVVTVELRPAD